MSVAISKAIELGFDTVACASTGNLANAVAAKRPPPGSRRHPHPVRPRAGQDAGHQIYGARVVGVEGTYDDVNRLCSEIAGKYGWGFVNVNLRPYYAEGSKSYAYEIAEQLGWRLPAHIVVPMAGGSLVTKIARRSASSRSSGWSTAAPRKPSIHGAQATGCAPIVDMVLENRDRSSRCKTPTTIAKSLAIGNPADGYYARQTIIGSGGWAAKARRRRDRRRRCSLLAETEGIFTETAGGVTLGAAIRLIESGQIGKDDGPVVICDDGQRHEDAGPAGREVARATADRPAPVRLRRDVRSDRKRN